MLATVVKSHFAHIFGKGRADTSLERDTFLEKDIFFDDFSTRM